MFIEQMEIIPHCCHVSVCILSPHPSGSLRCVGEKKRTASKYATRSVLRDAALRGRVRAQTVSSSAARRAGRPKIGMVAFGHTKQKVAGFLALPRDPRRHRAIIVIHEWWRLNEWVKEQAEKLAANGYVALAVDLYEGKVAADPSEARKLKRGLRQDRAIGDLKAAFGSLDRGIPPDKVQAFEMCMNAARKRVDIEIYDGAGHAFANLSNQEGYRPNGPALEKWRVSDEARRPRWDSRSGLRRSSRTRRSGWH